MRAIVDCCVNCYALISEYVCFKSDFKIANILHLYAQVLFYSVGIFVLLFIFDRPAVGGLGTVVNTILPMRGVYWYCTAYFCMSFFIPYFNVFVENADRKTLKKLLLTFIIVLSLLPIFLFYDIADVAEGYSALWFSVMYIIGAYIRKYGIFDNLSKKKLIFGYVVSFLLTWIFKNAVDIMLNVILHREMDMGILFNYTSPTNVLSALFLIALFSKLDLNKKFISFIKFFSPAAFGVYLLHDNPLFREKFISGKFAFLADKNLFVMVASIIACALAIWLIGSLIDKVRIFIFGKLKLKQRFLELENFVKAQIAKKYEL